MNFGEEFSGFIVIKGENQFNISQILDKIYFKAGVNAKYNSLMNSFKNSKINPLIIKIYENGRFKHYSFVFENKILEFINSRNNSPVNYNLSDSIKHLRLHYNYLNSLYKEAYFKYFSNNMSIPMGYHKLFKKDFNIWDINIYNETSILLNSKLTKEQSEKIIITLNEFNNIKEIPQNKFLINNIYKQYNLLHNKNT